MYEEGGRERDGGREGGREREGGRGGGRERDGGREGEEEKEGRREESNEVCGIEIKCCTDKRDKVLIMIKWGCGLPSEAAHEIPML